jgi:DNA-binding NarL/FixJ family response regulator
MTETMIAPNGRIAMAGGAGLAALPGSAVITVSVVATDPITQVGIVGRLRRSREIEVVAHTKVRAAVAVLVVDAIDHATELRVREHNQRGSAVVLVAARLDPHAVLPLLGIGVRAVLTRYEANADRLLAVVRAVGKGGVDLPASVLRYLIERAGPPPREPRALHSASLTARERDVLALVAEGLSTREVATRLAYSERTIKNVLQDLTTRLQLRNRTQAVAYAVRHGWI